MTTSEKKTTKKAPTKKAPATDRFGQFRDRAILSKDQTGVTLVTQEPFVVGEADGFSREYTIKPISYKTRLALREAATHGDETRAIALIFGSDLNDILSDLDDYEAETGEDPALVLNGLAVVIMEHFFGKDAWSKTFSNASI